MTPFILFALVLSMAILDVNVALLIGVVATWVAFGQKYDDKVEAAIKLREQKLKDAGKNDDQIKGLVRPLESTWTLFDWFFWLSMFSFFGLVVLDYSGIQICGLTSWLGTILPTYGFLFFGLGLFETWHVRKFLKETDFTPRLWFAHIALYPVVVIIQAAAAYELHWELSLLSPKVGFTDYGLLLFTTLILSFVAAARILVDTLRPNWVMSSGLSKRTPILLLVWLSPWIVLVAGYLLVQPSLFC